MSTDQTRLHFLIDVRSEDSETAHLHFGFDLAARFGAHLTGVQVVSIDASLIALPEPLRILEDEQAFAHGRREWWDRKCRSHGVDGAWEVRKGVYRRVLMRRASLTDVLIGRLHVPGSGIASGTGLLARVLMSRVTPMILVPDDAHPSLMRRILVTWNGSGVSARAIRAALPFLSRAHKIWILAGDRHGRARRDDADALLRDWFQRNALAFEWLDMGDDEVPGEAIERCAEKEGADAVVMGAWGRSRLREMALGGTTRYLLAHSRIPLFLSA